jgi:hypothetical protein
MDLRGVLPYAASCFVAWPKYGVALMARISITGGLYSSARPPRRPTASGAGRGQHSSHPGKLSSVRHVTFEFPSGRMTKSDAGGCVACTTNKFHENASTPGHQPRWGEREPNSWENA